MSDAWHATYPGRLSAPQHGLCGPAHTRSTATWAGHAGACGNTYPANSRGYGYAGATNRYAGAAYTHTKATNPHAGVTYPGAANPGAPYTYTQAHTHADTVAYAAVPGDTGARLRQGLGGE